MNKLIPVTGNSSLARDSKTGAVININTHEMELAKQRKSHRQQQKSEIEQLKNDVQELKQLVYKLAEKQ